MVIQTSTLAAPAIFRAPAAEVDFIDDAAEWQALTAQAPQPHLPQSYAYGEGKRATGWSVRRAIFSQGHRPVAFATVLERRVAAMRLLTRVNRGPLFLASSPAEGQIEAVYRALRRNWRGPLLIAPALPHGDASAAALRAAGFRRRQDRGWTSGRIDLCRSESDIWAGLGSNFRNRLRRGERAGAAIEIAADEAAYEWMLDRHVENMREKRFHAADPVLLRALRQAGPEDVQVFRLRHGQDYVAGMSVVRFGAVAEYHIGWFGPEGRRLNAGNLLMWRVLQELHRQGVASFDVGGLKPGDGYTQFKRTMRPVEFHLAGEWMSL